jgi:Lon protease-like protein
MGRMTAAKAETTVGTSSLEALRLFPLPDSVLFPGTLLPLHVFEPRYQSMVADALNGDRIIAVAMLQPGYEDDYEGRPPIHDVLGVGQIVHAQRLPDGRYYIALHGMCRARVVQELPANRPFRLARGTMLPDVLPSGGEKALHEALLLLKGCLAKLMSHTPERAEALAEVLGHLANPGMLADVVCALSLESPEARQTALSTDSVQDRLALATQGVAGLLLKAKSSECSRDLPL